MEIYTVGFTKKSAEQFFGLLKRAGIKRLLDIRLNNVSQLAGFTRRDDLKFFLREICGADYQHEPLLAPTKDILESYRKTKDWTSYEKAFNQLIAMRRIENIFAPDYFKTPTVLLCSEPTATQCHRRLVVEYLKEHIPGIIVTHL